MVLETNHLQHSLVQHNIINGRTTDHLFISFISHPVRMKTQTYPSLPDHLFNQICLCFIQIESLNMKWNQSMWTSHRLPVIFVLLFKLFFVVILCRSCRKSMLVFVTELWWTTTGWINNKLNLLSVGSNMICRGVSHSPWLPDGSCPARRSEGPAPPPGCGLRSWACSSPRWSCECPLHPATKKQVHVNLWNWYFSFLEMKKEADSADCSLKQSAELMTECMNIERSHDIS